MISSPFAIIHRCARFLLLLINFSCYSSYAQQTKIDSLRHLLQLNPGDKNKADLFINLARQYRLVDLPAAEETAREAFYLSDRIGYDPGRAAALQEWATVCFPLGKLDTVFALIAKGLDISRKNNYSTLTADFLYLSGMAYRKKENDSLTLRNFTECESLSRRINYPTGLGNAYKGFGYYYDKKGDYARALEYQRKAIAEAQHIGNQELEITSLNAIGSIYNAQGDYTKALEYYIRSTTIADASGNLVKAVESYGNMGIVQNALGDHSKALEHYLKALRLSKTVHNKSAEAYQYLNLVSVLSKLGRFDEAMNYARLDLQLRREMNDVRGLGYAYSSIGGLYKKNGDLRNALANYRQGLKYGEQIGYQLQISRSHLDIGELLLDDKQPKPARVHFQDALGTATGIGALQEISRSYLGLARTSKELGEMAQAYDYMILYTKANDSLITLDRNKQTARMQAQFETKEKETKISSLEKEARLNEKVNRQNVMVRNLVLAGLILLLCLAVLLYSRVRLKQHNNALLLIKNQEIEEKSILVQRSLEEKETLLREIHHRVKNNLQIISSLLNIQAEKVNDKNVISSIQEGQSRVQAMSLIHQNLYQSENLNNVEIENYLKQLVEYLSNMFTGKDRSISVNVEAKNIRFDVDTAIPLGLIVNELVSNAYKYAFEKKPGGQITIEIRPVDSANYQLRVADDGVGLPLAFNPEKSNSLGLKLVKLLSKQLKGSFTFESLQGACFLVQFKNLRPASA